MLWPSRTARSPTAIMKSAAIVEEGFVYQEETHLTVLKTSLFFAGDGFTAYDSKGELVFRRLLWPRRRRLRVTVMLSSAEVYRYNRVGSGETEPASEVGRARSTRSRALLAWNCTIFNTEKEAVAEIRRKVDASTNVVLGKDVFLLSLKPGFDGAFAMGLVLVLDQIHGADDDAEAENGSRVGVDPTNEDTNFSP
ncbi:UNVERIFIED_CONTAM: protein LURP-one-related 5 [Sesamum calycinum]|uniref:Protein LURP-one-related 5 n=1 Tax=Sesamum calycinum TaxID=2727403 RepID=A0AAW2NHT9_9LAMI